MSDLRVLLGKSTTVLKCAMSVNKFHVIVILVIFKILYSMQFYTVASHDMAASLTHHVCYFLLGFCNE